MINQDTEIYALNEGAITIVFGNIISIDLAERVLSFEKAIYAAPFEGFTTTIPAYATLTVCYDPQVVFKSALKGKSSYEKVSAYLYGLSATEQEKDTAKRQINIPVCYAEQFSPDLALVASHCQLKKEQVISMHHSATYLVHMIGFVPGFAYLGGMDTQLSTPRKEQPRIKVPAGAVGIAGGQTGIYSLDIPGGWQIIGHTPLRLFDADRSEPSLFRAGDEVRFSPISIDEFNALVP